MRYAVIQSFRVRTSQGELELNPDQVIILPPETANKLLNESKIKPFCYWLEKVIEDCQGSCFRSEGWKMTYECPYLKQYWNQLLESRRRVNK